MFEKGSARTAMGQKPTEKELSAALCIKSMLDAAEDPDSATRLTENAEWGEITVLGQIILQRDALQRRVLEIFHRAQVHGMKVPQDAHSADFQIVLVDTQRQADLATSEY